MNRRIILFICLLILPALSAAQDTHAAYVELGGPGLEYSLNYEYEVHENFAVRAGFAVPVLMRIFFDYQSLIVTGHYKRGENRGRLDLGGGLAVMSFRRFLFWELDKRITAVTPVLNIGYRNEPVSGEGVQFKIGFTPMFNLYDRSGSFVVPMAGLSLGYMF